MRFIRIYFVSDYDIIQLNFVGGIGHINIGITKNQHYLWVYLDIQYIIMRDN